MQTDQLLQDLTDEQRAAVTHVDGPLLIIAGAGSGKTRVITRRVAYLMGQGIPPSSILAITFTNKAAGEMKTRVSSLLARPLRDFGRLDQPWPLICTFHSLGLRILKHAAAAIGLPPGFSVYDTSDQEKLIKEAIKLAELNSTNFPPARIHHAISDAKNRLLTAQDFAQNAGDFYSRSVAKAYARYEQLLTKNNALDFDDLLLRVALAFRDYPAVLGDLQQRFQYILIDEYQDTNHAQYVVAHALALRHRNMCVVGDPDQSIYAWRGADIRNILDFEKDYQDARVIKLERNYRSTQVILDLASGLIAHNRERKDKRLWTENTGGERARLYLCEDEYAEARTIAEQFQALRKQGRSWEQMAVFYRINAMSRVVEDALRRSGIPYRIARGVDFYHRKEIKDVVGYLRAIANPDDELSLARIINVPARGISSKTVEQIQARALGQGKNLWQGLREADTLAELSTRAATAVRQFVQLMQRWRTHAARLAVPEEIHEPTTGVRGLVDDVVKTSGLEAYLRKSSGEELEEVANVNELISSAAQFDQENPHGTLDDFLGQISLVSDVDNLKDNGGAVTLMTLHAAKGLEFPVVAIVALEEGTLPHARVAEHPEQVEEERRLCFVGITRAQEILMLSQARRRTLRGQTLPTAASRFLAEMPPQTLEVVDTTGYARHEVETERIQAREESQRLAARFRRGQMVRHPAFGIGRITDIHDMGAHTRAVVDFTRAGRKTLILQYARLEPVG